MVGPACTPRIDLDNTFAAIDLSRQPDSDDDQSSQATDQSVSSDDNSDYGISTMTITNRKEITDLMTAIVPMAEPTMIYLQDFRKNVANALFTHKSKATKTGHAWLVETEVGYRKRTGDTRYQQHRRNQWNQMGPPSPTPCIGCISTS